MRVTITVAVPQGLRQARGCVAQMLRYRQRTGIRNGLAGGTEGTVRGVALGHAGEVKHHLGERQLAFRSAQALIGLPCVQTQAQRARVRVADILDSHAQQPPRQVLGRRTAIEHAREPIQRGIRVAAAYGLVQRRYLVIKRVPAFVEAARTFAGCLAYQFQRDAFIRQLCRNFEQRQAAARITIGEFDQEVLRTRLTIEPWQVRKAPGNHLLEFRCAQRLQHVHPGARQKRRVQLETRIFGRGTDKHDGALLHMRQKRILLRLIETMNFVDEKYRALTVAQALFGLGDGGANLFHTREHGREADKLVIAVFGEQPCKGGLAATRGTPEHHGVQSPAGEQPLQRAPRTEQVALANELVEALGSQRGGKRSVVFRV